MSYQVQQTPLCARCIIHTSANLRGLEYERVIPSKCRCPVKECGHHRPV